MAKDAIDFSRPAAELIGGGEFFHAGLYLVQKSHFTYFDFKQGPGKEALCLFQELQPLNEDREPVGEAVARYWGVGGKLPDGTVLIEPVNPVKGVKGAWTSLRFTDESRNDKFHPTQDFTIFFEQAQKAEVDMDAVGNDWSAFEGMVLEYGLLSVKNKAKAKSAVEVAEGADKAKGKESRETRDVVVVTGVPKKAKGGTAKPKAKPEPEEEEVKPRAKKKKGPESIIAAYLESEVVPEVKKEGSAGVMDHKIAFARHLKKELGMDAEEVNEVMAVYNDREEGLPAAAETVGLMINKSKEFVLREK